MPEYVTSEGLRRLEEELEEFRTSRRREVAEYLKRATEVGGTVDNAEYEDAKRQQASVEGRIMDLERLLQNAVAVPDHQTPPETVEIGATVTVANESGARTEYMLVGSHEADPLQGHISYESPVGSALMGKRVGERAEAKTPAGLLRLTIEKIL
jgi:transcription elongation factor GreA